MLSPRAESKSVATRPLMWTNSASGRSRTASMAAPGTPPRARSSRCVNSNPSRSSTTRGFSVAATSALMSL
ncbi:hypothetical protein BDV98DRAFT_376209 [Pterulicium gracile]|uniref:Uncharacterized protein n=1 Tax=Pterulicium gracile TaxID=1884261 RepID=A0A5C3Q271_9AGAR|nr:hypothetical protein BDV98DRAFT_376209 [Pterula gracilis]